MLQKRWWQLYLNSFVHISENLRFLRPFRIMLFSMFEVVLDHFAKSIQRFAGDELGRERIVDRWQHLLLDLAQRNSVIGLFSGQFFYRKITWKIDDHQPRLARF